MAQNPLDDFIDVVKLRLSAECAVPEPEAMNTPMALATYEAIITGFCRGHGLLIVRRTNSGGSMELIADNRMVAKLIY